MPLIGTPISPVIEGSKPVKKKILKTQAKVYWAGMIKLNQMETCLWRLYQVSGNYRDYQARKVLCAAYKVGLLLKGCE